MAIYDNGRGLNIARIRENAAGRKILNATHISPQSIASLIFHEGLSTAENVTEISGRGSGMGAVKDIAESLSGSAKVELTSPKDNEHYGFKLIVEITA